MNKTIISAPANQVGRALSSLESAWANSGGACLVLEGPVGSGKSRQLDVTRAEALAMGMDAVVVRATETDRLVGFCPLAAAFGSRQPAGLDFAAAVAELACRIEDRVADQPLLIALDDVHQVGEHTALALRVLVTKLAHRPVVWLMTRRPYAVGQLADQPAQHTVDWLVDQGARRMRLTPLDDWEIAQMFTDMIGVAPDESVCSQLMRSGGNPFLSAERIRAFRAGDQLEIDGGVARLRTAELPDRFLDAIGRWLGGLSGDALRLLDAAAVLGRSFTVHQLAGMLHRSATDIIPAVTEAVVAGFLADDGSALVFQHELLREAIYRRLYGPVRLALHREASHVLRAEEGPAREIAEHLIRSGRVRHGDGVAALREAVDQVTAAEPETAADLLLTALDVVDPRHAARPTLVADTVRVLVAAGRTTDARRLYDDVRNGGPELPHEVRRLVEDEQHAETGPGGRVTAAVARSLAARDAGDLRCSVMAAREAVTVAAAAGDEAPDERPQPWLVSALTAEDRFSEAHAELESGSDRPVTPLSHYHHAELCLATGRLDDAVTQAEAGLSAAERQGAEDVAGPLLSLLGQLAIHRDDLVAAADYLERARQPRPVDLLVPAEDGRWRHALLLMAHGRHTDALAALEGVCQDLPDRMYPLTRERRVGATLVRLCLAAGEPARAAKVAAAMERLRDLNPDVVSLAAAADHATGLVRRDTALLRRAVETYQRTHRPLDTAAALEDLAGAEHMGGDDARAVTLLEQARDHYQECAATRDMARVSAALRRLGVRTEPARARKRAKAMGELTESELRVVRLVADGLTNRQIAHRLFLSPHTVDSHLRHSFTKLGVNSRVELTKRFLLHHAAARSREGVMSR